MKNPCLSILGILSLFLISGFGTSSSAHAADPPVIVTIEGGSFSPEAAVIPPGGEVIWRNRDAAAHTVTADDGSFDSGALGQGDEFRKTFPSAGTVTYSCDNHAWMKGRIEVR